MFVPATPALTASSLAPVGIVTEVGETRLPTLSAARTTTSPSARRPASHRRRDRHRHLRRYRLVEVSWYGGGGSLACGGWLTSATLGVANKTLPCGTRVTLRYHGRTVRVRVIDRGPYVAGREYDLTEATARALGFEGVGEVWAAS
ncbi:MAG: septal ring lytic transglycosylase RlpA family protein [Solirubrobacteraceae bacterium]|jgi:rare lipoprotein A (peptidoglycan hydrolase)